MPCSLAQTMLCIILKKVDTIIRRLRPLERAASGTRAAPYPYSKMCELCELCELFVKKLLSKTECAILTDCALFM